MALLTINIPDALRSSLQGRAVAAGYATLEQYVESILCDDADPDDYGGPEHLTARSRPHVEAMLNEALKSPARPMDAAEWNSMRQALIDRHQDGIR